MYEIMPYNMTIDYSDVTLPYVYEMLSIWDDHDAKNRAINYFQSKGVKYFTRQCSVTHSHLWCGGIFSDDVITNLLLSCTGQSTFGELKNGMHFWLALAKLACMARFCVLDTCYVRETLHAADVFLCVTPRALISLKWWKVRFNMAEEILFRCVWK